MLNIAKKDQLDRLHFRMRLAEALIKANKTISRKKLGRPNDKNIGEKPKVKLKRPKEDTKPIAEVQMPFLDNNKERETMQKQQL